MTLEEKNKATTHCGAATQEDDDATTAAVLEEGVTGGGRGSKAERIRAEERTAFYVHHWSPL